MLELVSKEEKKKLKNTTIKIIKRQQERNKGTIKQLENNEPKGHNRTLAINKYSQDI